MSDNNWCTLARELYNTIFKIYRKKANVSHHGERTNTERNKDGQSGLVVSWGTVSKPLIYGS